MCGNDKSRDDPSVTRWVSELKLGDDEAARQLWEHYFDRLARVASSRMRGKASRAFDEEDVALSVFDVLCRGALDGRFEALTSRDELWRLLVAMTAQKVIDRIRYELRVKRGGGNIRGHSIVARGDGEDLAGFDAFAGSDPSPEFLALVEERQQLLMARLRNDSLRKIARMRLNGCTNQEISQALSISLRSVERKLSLIRQEWTAALDEQ